MYWGLVGRPHGHVQREACAVPEPAVDIPPTIPDLLRRAAERFGDRDYLIGPGGRLTFHEAEERSRRLGKRLLAMGVGKGTRVGMLFPQSADFVVAFLAIARIGALAVPLSTLSPAYEIRRAARHADLHTLIVPSMIVGRDATALLETTWPELGGTRTNDLFILSAPHLRRILVCGDSDRPWASGSPALDRLDDSTIGDDLLRAIEAEVAAADLLVMIHTSGSTAEPKAVVHTHGSLVRLSSSLARLYELSEHSRTFTTMPFFWVGGLTVVLLTHLQVGGAVLTVERVDPPAMLDLIETERPTRLVGWMVLERLQADPSFADRDLSSITEFIGSAPPGPRHGSLGMSETGGPHSAVRSSENRVDLPKHLWGSFGRSVPGMEHKIIDADSGDAIPDGGEGEICVRGMSLMHGLYKKERSETFDPDGWFRTGDRGLLRDGILFFTGRSTEMIKTGGANVAPAEVELALRSLPGVTAAFVVGVPDLDRGEVVACVVGVERDCQLATTAVEEQLRELLSSYKVPRKVVVVPYDELPWQPSGKVSRAALRELIEGRSP